MIPRWPSGRAIAQWAMAILVAYLACAWWWPRPTPLPADGHLQMSLTTAINMRYCGSRSFGDRALIEFVLERPERDQRPIPELLVQRMGSLGAYCGTLNQRFLNNENSLMWLMLAGLGVHPSASIAWIGRWLLWFKVGGLVLFAIAALSLGSGALIAALSFAAGLALLANLSAQAYYSVYTLLLPVTLANAGFWGLALARAGRRRIRSHLAVMLLGGLIAGFSAQVRTSYAPIFGFLALSYCVAAWRLHGDPSASSSPRRSGAFIGGSCAAFIVGYLAFVSVFITPLIPPSARNYSHHAIAHPLVLALAVPENDLTRREGIAWHDGVGLVLARRVDPSAEYLGRGYSEALTSYYLGLWKRYPRQMIDIYWRKSAMAGRAVITSVRNLNGGRLLVGVAVLPFWWVSDGHWLFVLLVAITLTGFGIGWQRRSPRLMAAGALAGVLVLLQIESSIIMPWFYPTLHTTYLGVAVNLGLLTYEAGFRAIAAAYGRQDAPFVWAFAVFAAILMAALVTSQVTQVSGGSTVLAAPRSDLAIALAGTMAFTAVRALGGRYVALVVPALLIGALAASAAASTDVVLLLAAPAGAPPHVRVVGAPLPAAAREVGDLIGSSSKWTFKAQNVRQSERRVVVDGPVEQRHSYLLVSIPRRLEGGTYLVADGDLLEGGITVGMQQANNWMAYKTIVETGPFRASLAVPKDGDYQLVLANAVASDSSRNVVTLSSVVVVR